MNDLCQRCGEVGDDRRTLWMACLYDMGELGLPFEQLAVRGPLLTQKGEKKIDFGPHSFMAPVFEEPTPNQPVHDYRFYTMLVCKDCRADWMTAITKWFRSPARDEQTSCGSGIFVRENGTSVEITREEWDRRHPDREPVTWKPEILPPLQKAKDGEVS